MKQRVTIEERLQIRATILNNVEHHLSKRIVPQTRKEKQKCGNGKEQG